MANYTCDLNALIQASKCVSDLCMSDSDRKAIELYARIWNLAAIGGKDYRNNLSLLMKDSMLWQKRSADTLHAVDTYITILNAVADGAAIGTDPKTILKNAKCMGGNCIGKESMRGLLAYLKCAINQTDNPS